MTLKFEVLSAFKALSAFAVVVTVAPAIGLAADPVPTVISPLSAGNTGAAPIGVAATTSQLLFSQPFCPPCRPAAFTRQIR